VAHVTMAHIAKDDDAPELILDDKSRIMTRRREGSDSDQDPDTAPMCLDRHGHT